MICTFFDSKKCRCHELENGEKYRAFKALFLYHFKYSDNVSESDNDNKFILFIKSLTFGSVVIHHFILRPFFYIGTITLTGLNLSRK